MPKLTCRKANGVFHRKHRDHSNGWDWPSCSDFQTVHIAHVVSKNKETQSTGDVKIVKTALSNTRRVKVAEDVNYQFLADNRC